MCNTNVKCFPFLKFLRTYFPFTCVDGLIATSTGNLFYFRIVSESFILCSLFWNGQVVFNIFPCWNRRHSVWGGWVRIFFNDLYDSHHRCCNMHIHIPVLRLRGVVVWYCTFLTLAAMPANIPCITNIVLLLHIISIRNWWNRVVKKYYSINFLFVWAFSIAFYLDIKGVLSVFCDSFSLICNSFIQNNMLRRRRVGWISSKM